MEKIRAPETGFADMKNFNDERILFQGASGKRSMNKAVGVHSRDDDLDVAKFSQNVTMTH